MNKLIFSLLLFPLAGFAAAPPKMYQTQFTTNPAGGIMNQATTWSNSASRFSIVANKLISSTNPVNGVLNVLSFGAKSVNDTAIVQAAIDTLGVSGGTVMLPPIGSPWYIEGLVINSPIRFIGPGFQKDYTGNFSNYVTSVTGVNPIIRVGNGTSLVKGVTIQDTTFYSPSAASQGIYFSTAMECEMRNVAIWGFKTNLFCMAGTTQPCTLNRFYNLWLQNANQENTRSIKMVMPVNQSSFTTDIEFYGIHINGLNPGFTNAYAMELDGCAASFIGGYMDLQGGDGTSILLSFNNPGTLGPILYTDGLQLDGGGSATLITIDPSYSSPYPFDKLVGTYSASGKIKLASGELFTLPLSAWASSTLFAPTITGGLMFFTSGSRFTNTGELYLGSDANDGMFLHSTNNVALNAPTIRLNGLTGAGTVLIDSGQYLGLYQTNGTTFPALASLASSALQIYGGDQSPFVEFIVGTNSAANFRFFVSDPDGVSFPRLATLGRTGLTVHQGPATDTAVFIGTNGTVNTVGAVHGAFIHPVNAQPSTLIQTDGVTNLVSIANQGNSVLLNNGTVSFWFAGKTTNINVLCPGPITNQLQFVSGVLSNVVQQ